MLADVGVMSEWQLEQPNKKCVCVFFSLLTVETFPGKSVAQDLAWGLIPPARSWNAAVDAVGTLYVM